MFEDKEKTMDAMQEPSGNLLNLGKIEIGEPEVAASEETVVVASEETVDAVNGEVVKVAEKAAPEEEKPVIPASSVKPEKEKADPRKIVSIVGIICGAIILIMGLVSMAGAPYDETATVAAKSTTYTSYEFYGGDAYSGIQQAGADASNNAAAAADNIALVNNYLIELSNLMSKLVGYLLIAFGLMTICGSAYGLASVKARKQAATDSSGNVVKS